MMPKLRNDRVSCTVSPSARAIDVEEVIDQALGLLYAEWHHLAARLSVECATPLDRQQLRDGPLGRDLRRLAAIARGEATADPLAILEAVEAVLQLLFWPAGGRDFSIPRGFWLSDLGLMLTDAIGRAYAAADRYDDAATVARPITSRAALYRRGTENAYTASIRDQHPGFALPEVVVEQLNVTSSLGRLDAGYGAMA